MQFHLTRREAIARIGGGLGSLGLLSALQAASPVSAALASSNALPHFAPRAKRVIHLFMNGGPFGPDFFDPKPALTQFAGQRPAGADLRTERPTGGLLPVPFKFSNHGQSGLPPAARPTSRRGRNTRRPCSAAMNCCLWIE